MKLIFVKVFGAAGVGAPYVHIITVHDQWGQSFLVFEKIEWFPRMMLYSTSVQFLVSVKVHSSVEEKSLFRL